MKMVNREQDTKHEVRCPNCQKLVKVDTRQDMPCNCPHCHGTFSGSDSSREVITL